MLEGNAKWSWFVVVVSGMAVLLVVAATLLDSRAILLLRNTFALAGGAASLAVPLGAAIAFLLLRTDLPGRKVQLVAFGAMLFVPLYLQAAGWDAGFGKQGWYSYSHGSVAQPILDGMLAAIWIHAVAALPWVIVIVGLGLLLVEPEAEEAALLDGSMIAVFCGVTVRRAAPFVAAATLWILVIVGTEMTVTDLYRVRTFAEEIYIDVPFVGAIDALQPLRPTGLTTVLLVGSLVAVSLLFVSRLSPPSRFPAQTQRRVFQLGHWRWPLAIALALITLFVLGVPLLNMVYKAGLVVEQMDGSRVRRWLPDAFASIVLTSPRRFGEEHGWTLLIGGLAATASVTIAAPLGWYARRGRLREVPALMLAATCISIPGPMLGLAVIWMLNREGSDVLIWLYDRSVFAPWLAMLIKSLPMALFVVWYAFRTVPDELLENACVEGATRLTKFLRIGLASHRRSLAVAWLASYAVASGDVSASILVRPPGVTTVPVRVFELLHSGVDDRVAGICLTTFCTFAAIGGLIMVLMRPTKIRIGSSCVSEYTR